MVIIAAIYINNATKPQLDTDENLVAVGGMVYSDTAEYKSEEAGDLGKNPVMKIIEMSWLSVRKVM